MQVDLEICGEFRRKKNDLVMAVQAQSPANPLLPDIRVRPEQLYARENNNVMPPVTFGTSNFEDSTIQSAAPAKVSNQLQLFDTIANFGHLQQQVSGAFPAEADDAFVCGFGIGSRKRPRVNGFVSSLPRRLAVADLSQSNATAAAVSPQSVGLSTGLHLTFRDELFEPLAPSSSGRMSTGFSYLSLLSEDLKPQLSKQREEIDEFIKNQEEQVRKTLEEKRQQHSRAILAIIENWLERTLREKELEVETVKTRNTELEEKIRNLFQQACAWQSRAKFNEAMMFALRSNLQQAVAISREQSKEGCGDSHQAGDAESSYPDDTDDAHARAFRENKQLKEQRSCKVCRRNDVSVLLLPCRHLCLCKECEATLDSCPLCRSFKSASVQVYLT
ncbi:hypothetical protein O6H91_Y264400 [Diphasiastrum complanatum]|nr:hypothetical protein O6H91_Y264400 [Diphasiastrum complanatum]